MAGSSLGVFNQGAWSGVGDVDECWIIATYWALVASGVMRRQDLPTIREFREAAGKPDKKGPTGGNNKNLMLALKTLIPQADAQIFVGGIAAFTKALQRGYVASLSVLSAALPKHLRFGFEGSHQVSIYYKAGKFYLANPLAKEGSALVEISAADLLRAAAALFRDNKLHAVLIKPGDQKKLEEEARKKLPIRPRDLAAPIIVQNYIDPRATARFTRDRFKRSGS